jgi:hypothetical protein
MFKLIMIILIFLLMVCCVPVPKQPEKKPYIHTLVIVEVYQEDVEANDGEVQRRWKTTVKITTNGGRDILNGKWGMVGDTLNMYYGGCCGLWSFTYGEKK